MAYADDSQQGRYGDSPYEPFPLHRWIWDHLGTSTLDQAAPQQADPTGEISSPTVTVSPESSVVVPQVSQPASEGSQGIPAALKEFVAAIQSAIKELKQPEQKNASVAQAVAQEQSTPPQAASPVVPEITQATVQAPVVAIDSSPGRAVSEPQDAGFGNGGLLPAAFRPAPSPVEEQPQNSTAQPATVEVSPQKTFTTAYPTVESVRAETGPQAQTSLSLRSQIGTPAVPNVAQSATVADPRPELTVDSAPYRNSTPQVERQTSNAEPMPETSLRGQQPQPSRGIDLSGLKQISESVDQGVSSAIGDQKAMVAAVVQIGQTIQQAMSRMAGEAATNRKAITDLQEQLAEQMVLMRGMLGESDYGNAQFRAAGGAYG